MIAFVLTSPRDKIMHNYEDYIGKTILIELRYYNPEGQFKSSEQIAGKIVENLDNRIRLIPVGSDIAFHLPPDLSLLKNAQPGIYTLKNGNVKTFENPAYTVGLDIHQAHDEWESMYPEGFSWPS